MPCRYFIQCSPFIVYNYYYCGREKYVKMDKLYDFCSKIILAKWKLSATKWIFKQAFLFLTVIWFEFTKKPDRIRSSIFCQTEICSIYGLINGYMIFRILKNDIVLAAIVLFGFHSPYSTCPFRLSIVSLLMRCGAVSYISSRHRTESIISISTIQLATL